MASLTQSISGALSRMTDRERLLVIVTAIVAAILLVVGAAYSAGSAIEGREKRIRMKKQQVSQILSMEATYKNAERDLQAAKRKLEQNRVSLFSKLETAASKLGLELKDLNEKKTPERDFEGIQRVSVVVNLKNVSIDKLNQFLEEIEGKRQGGMVQIVRLRVKTRHDNDQLLDVSMTVATWKKA